MIPYINFQKIPRKFLTNKIELADYILQLKDNDQKYNEYFSWKNNGLSDKFLDKIQQCVYYNSKCRLCESISQLKMKQPNMAHGNDVFYNRSYAIKYVFFFYFFFGKYIFENF